LQTDGAFITGSVRPTNNGRVYCGVESLGQSPDATALYDWIFCQEFYDDSGSLARGAGVSAPVLLQVRGAGAQTQIVAWHMPRDGSLYVPDVEQLFPPDIAREMLAHNSTARITPSEAELTAEARTDLDDGLLQR
jgi:hypothetical protein